MARPVTNFTDVEIANDLNVRNDIKLVSNLVFDKTTADVKVAAANPAAESTYTIPDVGTTANFVMTAGAQTIAGTKTFSTPLVKASLNNSVKRHRLIVPIAAGGVLADSTVYKAFVPIGQIATVTGVFAIAQTPGVGGTNTLKVLKANSAGNTMLSAASFNPTTLVANTISSIPLTGTGADLAVTAAQGIYVEYSTGVQTTDAENVAVVIEYELTDF